MSLPAADGSPHVPGGPGRTRSGCDGTLGRARRAVGVASLPVDSSNPQPLRPEQQLARRGGLAELLWPAAWLYGGVARLRNAAYERGFLPSFRLEAPVVCVGNLTAGGTGKTPFTVWVCRELERRGLRPGVLSRGYGSTDGGPNDETRALAAVLPGTPCVQDADRVRGGERLATRHRVDVVVLDDGFQHRRLRRDLDLVLVDATRPWGLAPPPGGGAPVRAMLPRGLLREPPCGLARADAVVVTRADQVDPATLEALLEELAERAPGRGIATAAHRPSRLHDAAGSDLGLESLYGREVDLVSGIGNPEAFEATVRRLGARVAEHRRFPDHHAFAPGDLAGLGGAGRWIVATTKDAPKLPTIDAPVVLLEVEIAILTGAPVLAALLDSLPTGRQARERRALHEGLHG